jgi:hypothetical protein
MKALYRTAAAVLTLVSAAIIAILVSVATDPDRDIKVLGFTLFALGAAILLALAVALWSRTVDRKDSGARNRTPRP